VGLITIKNYEFKIRNL